MRTYLIALALLCGDVETALPTGEQPTKQPFVDEIPNVNVSTILRAIGTPHCMKQCIGPVALVSKKLLSFKETTALVQELCSAFSEAKECLNKHSYCGFRSVYNTITSGIEYMCVSKRESFERVEPCLRGTIDNVLQACDASCELRSTLEGLSRDKATQMAAALGGGPLMVAKHVAPFCSVLKCTLPCVTKRANDACPLSGWLILDSLLQPFDRAAAMYEKAPSLVKQLVREQLSEKCSFLYNTTSLIEMRKGHL